MAQKYHFALAALALLLALGLCACSGGTAALPSPTPSSEAATPSLPSSADSGAIASPETTPALPLSAEASVTQCAAHYFPDIQGCANLYVAVEFRNESSANAIVSSVSVVFTVNGKTVEHSFTPPCSEYDIIAPGAVSTAAGWFAYSGSAPDGAVTATAEVTLEPVGLPQQKPLAVSDLMIVQNYPGFATVSGRAANTSEEADYDLTMIYLSFYDAEGTLLGVQFFTKDLMVKAGDARDFVYHLRCLPIEGLTENTATITARGMGIS
ncbi:MAG: hypothetical protein ACOYIR_00465 [Christensenellales bacterium]|jgi:hypothetical protein